MIKRTRRVADLRRSVLPFSNEETQLIQQKLREKTGDEALSASLQFSPTAVSGIRQLARTGGVIVCDTQVLANLVKDMLPEGLPVEVRCYIDDKEVLLRADAMRTTRAEVAVDLALESDGGKLFVIGSAPAAFSRLMQHRMRRPLTGVSVLTSLNGFANAVPLKERLRESDMPFILTRGKNGGVNAACDILECVLETIKEKG
ncbi:MAG: precorrin-8X methylmutase [Clostridia bacterium]|nr:precorrin-8X methylmutase [Clostridia bacterium]